MFLYCIFCPHCIFLWPEDVPQWPKHVVILINRIQRQLCLTYPPHPPPNLQYLCFSIAPLSALRSFLQIFLEPSDIVATTEPETEALFLVLCEKIDRPITSLFISSLITLLITLSVPSYNALYQHYMFCRPVFHAETDRQQKAEVVLCAKWLGRSFVKIF